MAYLPRPMNEKGSHNRRPAQARLRASSMELVGLDWGSHFPLPETWERRLFSTGQGSESVVSSTRMTQKRGKLTGDWPSGSTTQQRASFVGDGQWLVHNQCAATRRYVSSPKHAPGGRWGTLMDLPDDIAQQVLADGIASGKQVYGYYGGKP